MRQNSLFSTDKIVLDIETKNTFSEGGGQENRHLLEVSFVGIYSYQKDKYFSFFAICSKVLIHPYIYFKNDL